ncbi:helix-turn-helix transcriptional regulator [Kribbella sp. NPDC051952]|uniref:helix-turn-helix domain-containing protein n=1 Tax=Kribbella sp. NPDC051952 TaxID=3154851 RepID=UPI00341EAC16
MAPSAEAVVLARRLRDLRESRGLTQKALAQALSGDDTRVAMATISSWESAGNPKLPPAERLRSYALLFSTTDDATQLPREQDLNAAAQERFNTLHRELIGLRDAVRGQVGSSIGGSYLYDFEHGPITIICPEAPVEGRSPMAAEDNPNHTRMYRYADLDSLVELWGHIRASNPELKVGHRLPAEIVADDLSGHLIVLGGIAWNQVTNRLQRVLNELPVQQVKVSDLENGEIFRRPDGEEFRPEWEPREGAATELPSAKQLKSAQMDDVWRNGKRHDLIEDVGLVARLPNPFNHRRTITICNGVYSRGVLGAVRTFTDLAVRERNEAYVASQFPGGSFVMVLRVPVVNGEAISPDLENPENRLFEWPSSDEAAE